MGTVEHFEFLFAPAYERPARLFGVRRETAWVEVGEESFEARFGPWRVRTPLSNIVDFAVTGPYAFWKTAGPARLAITDRGLTFATTGQAGVLVTFATAVRGIDSLGIIRHPELTVTVRETDRLVALLRERRSAPAP